MKEVFPVLPTHRTGSDQAEVSFIDESRWLEGMTGPLEAHGEAGEAAEFTVDEVVELRLWHFSPVARLFQQQRDVLHGTPISWAGCTLRLLGSQSNSDIGRKAFHLQFEFTREES